MQRHGQQARARSGPPAAAATATGRSCSPPASCACRRLAPSCHGAGSVITDPCESCRGRGYVPERAKLDVTIPAGIDDGMRVRLAGYGEPSPDGGPPGDCYCFVTVRKHKLFQRDGTHLILQMPITYSQAALGATIEVPTLQGPFELTMPAGTQSGEVFRIRGRGLPDPRGGATGDLHVQTYIEVPKKLTPNQERLLREIGRRGADGSLAAPQVVPGADSGVLPAGRTRSAGEGVADHGQRQTTPAKKTATTPAATDAGLASTSPRTRKLPTWKRSCRKPIRERSVPGPSWKTIASAPSASWPTSAATPSCRWSAICWPSLDNLKRAIEAALTRSASEGVADTSLLEGVKLVAAQFEAVLKQHGCTPIETVGQPFDPNQHQAIAQEPSDQYPAGTVTRAAQSATSCTTASSGRPKSSFPPDLFT